MTAPSPADVGTQIPFTIPISGQAVKVTDSGNSPVGAVLINRGDNGQTIWVQAGPAGGAAVLPLGPSGTLRWTDRQQIPYARLAPGATAPETLILTNQSADYTNPTAVAVAVALQLATQGIPSTFVDTALGTYALNTGSTSAAINVGGSASLVVSASWPAAPYNAAAFTMTFTDPDVPDLPAIIIYGSNDNSVEQSQNVWRVPVLAPRMVIKNIGASGDKGYFSVVGNNRNVDRFSQLGQLEGAAGLYGTANSVTTRQPLYPYNGAPARTQTRFNGRVKLITNTNSAGGFLEYYYVDARGVSIQVPVQYTGPGVQTQEIAHPSVPCSWVWYTNAATAGGFIIGNLIALD